MVDPLPMVDLIPRPSYPIGPVPMVDLVHVVDPIPMGGPLPMVDP